GVVTAAAGEDWDSLVARSVERNWAGVECLSGIPGTVGGTPIQIVGAYGQEASEVIDSVRALDRTTRRIVTLARGDCGFTYRRTTRSLWSIAAARRPRKSSPSHARSRRPSRRASASCSGPSRSLSGSEESARRRRLSFAHAGDRDRPGRDRAERILRRTEAQV